MTQNEMDQLPELELYRVEEAQIMKYSPLFTQEAVAELAAGTAIGMIAVEENIACGAICMKLMEGDQEGMLDLISLYVVPEYRRKGVAGTLFLEMMENVFEATDGIVHYCRYVGEKNSEDVRKFLEQAGFVFEEEELAGSFLMTVKDLEKAPLNGFRASLPADYRMVSVPELSALERKKIFQTLSEAGIAYMTEAELENACQEISYAVFDARRELAACAFFTEHESRLCLCQFFIKPGPSGEGIKMLQTCVRKAVMQYGGKTQIEIPILTDSSLRLMEKLLGKCRRIPMCKAYFEM